MIVGPPPPRPCGKSSFIQFLDSKLNTEKVELFEDEIRCAVSVHDVVLAIVNAVINKEQKLPHLLNLGGPQPLSRVDMGISVCEYKGYNKGNCVAVKRSEQSNPPYPSPLDISMDSSLVEETLLGRKLTKFDEVVRQVC